MPTDEINPFNFAHNLISTYKRYLFTATQISDDEPRLKEEFWHQLDGYQFVNGPFIQYQPTYKRTNSFSEMFTDKDLDIDPRLEGCFSQEDIRSPDFRLYSHQAEAIVQAKRGENIVIATGTGSGKTECFILPILDDVLKNPGTGVRSIIVYPMNALANDQLERLASMLAPFKHEEITFGRYTGETPENEKEAKERYPDHVKLINERFTREEIRLDPPHILLTNFAMLEYLLIRPRDVELFRHQRLRYVVLDEAHTYTGAQGIEVALLMRRLQEAYRSCKFQYFLTSATFMSPGGDSKYELCRFAESLTGKVFKEENVLTGTTETPINKNANQKLTRDKVRAILPDQPALDDWISSVDEEEKLAKLMVEVGIVAKDGLSSSEKTYQLLYRFLHDDKITMTLFEILLEGPIHLHELSKRLWGDINEESLRFTHWLLLLGGRSKVSPDSVPLIKSRFHWMFRGLAGASVCLSPDCPDKEDHSKTKWSHFSLQPLRNCPHCQSKMFELEICAHCGLPVIPVFIFNEQWFRYPPIGSSVKKVITWWEGLGVDDPEETDQDTGQEHYVWLCMRCGSYSENKPESDHCSKAACGGPIVRLHLLHDVEGNIEKCPRCGGEAGVLDGVTRSFITGDDAPTAVIGEMILRSMPAEEGGDKKPAGGRRLLAFSDSRQRAAFYAPYLKRTTCESAFHQPLLQSIMNSLERNQFSDFSEVARNFALQASTQPYLVLWDNTGKDNEAFRLVSSRQLTISIRKQLERQCLISLYRHFCNSPRQRNKLMGLALCSVFVELTEAEKDILKQRLPELCSDDHSQYLPAIQLLFDLFLTRKAVRFLDNIASYELGGVVMDSSFHREQSTQKEAQRVYRWNPFYASSRHQAAAVSWSRQLQLISKFLNKDPWDDQEQLSNILDRFWETLYDRDAPGDSALIDHGNGRRKLNGDRLLIEAPDIWFRCSQCGFLVPPSRNYHNFCPSPECRGALEQITKSDLDRIFLNNHYRSRFFMPPFPVEAKEHTAQLQLNSSKEYQEQFKKGFINALSCSTTFEMGVDVGALKVVLLRNVPPTPANYIQRAGRAGRRREGASYAVTFARKVPHDQHYFAVPREMIAGEVKVPIINLANTVLAQRHVNSFLLGKYLKDVWVQKKSSSISIDDFFMVPDHEHSVSESFPVWLMEKRNEVVGSLGRIIPEVSRLTPDDAFGSALRSLYSDDEECVFRKYITATLTEYEGYLQELARRSRQVDTSHQAKAAIHNIMHSIENYKDKFLKTRLIDYLSKVGWLPGYAFPQDTTELRVLQPKYSERMNLTRDRSIAISEYAPGTEIVADGKVFKSKGLVGRRKKADKSLFEPKQYVLCTECRIIKQFPLYRTRPPKKCDCGRAFQRPRTYVIPEGFSTYAKDVVEDPRFRRILPPPSSEVFLVEGCKHEDFIKHQDIKWATYALKHDGELFRANLGFKKQQFRVCMACGMAIEQGNNGTNHDTLWGWPCTAGGQSVKQVDLAHEFKTDILEMRFLNPHIPSPPIGDRAFWLSFLNAFLNGASRELGIDRGDLDGIYQRIPDSDAQGELIIYDRIPGGAGYLPRIVKNLDAVLSATLNVVKNCNNPGCTDLGSSCYTCLRSYNNQHDWEHLKREPVINWLSNLWVPENMKETI